MSDLPDPISDVLEDTADEARVRRLWDGIDAERGRRSRRSRSSNVGPAIALGVVAVAAAALLYFGTSEEPEQRAALSQPEVSAPVEPAPSEEPAEPVDDGPLQLAAGEPFGSVHAEAARVVELSDGSSVELSAGVTLVPVRNDQHELELTQSEGRIRYLVRPGGQRRWRIDAGIAEVTVVGTVFTVERRADEVTVEVERGIVRVASEHLEERVRLMRGDRLRVGPTSNETTHVAPAPRPPRPPVATEDAEALMARADAARREGRFDDAVELLSRAMARSGDPAAGVAAFTLGRLELDALSHPDRALAAFERALELPLPPAMRESAEARIVEAHARAGRTDEATRAAEAYLSAHPSGRHASEVRAHLPP